MSLQNSNERVMVLGQDGFLGWALTVYLKVRGINCYGIDNFSRRNYVTSVGSDSLIPIGPHSRVDKGMDILHRLNLEDAISTFKPTTIVHFAEQSSAPYSMKSPVHAATTQHNNVIGTMNLLWTMRDKCPDAHLIKLGTLGEYSDWIYKDSPIPEDTRISVLRVDPDMPSDKNHFLDIPTPRFSGSFYHMSKIFDSFNIEFACKIWGLRATDINQGVVYGSKIEGMDEDNRTRFDYDSYFGTVVNRFIVQAISKVPLTVYGAGGQTRGYININDVMRAVELVMAHPPEVGKLQIVNQLTEVRSVNEVSELVSDNIKVEIENLENPRIEKEKHDYKPTYKKLKNWGLTDPKLMRDVIPEMIEDLSKFKNNINADVIAPVTNWRK